MHAVRPHAWLLKAEQPAKPALEAPPQPALSDGGQSRRILACAYCRRAITTAATRIEMRRAHEHAFTNPHGVRYRIGCFARAAGCEAVGPPSDFWTWFPPYAWQIEQCKGCGEHLGWLFRTADHRFHGLILDRLLELEEGPQG